MREKPDPYVDHARAAVRSLAGRSLRLCAAPLGFGLKPRELSAHRKPTGQQKTRTAPVACFSGGTLLAPDAHARVVRFDLFGRWDQPTFLDLAVDGAATVDLGFEIDFGLGATSAITIHEHGFVTFGNGQQITVFDDRGFDFASRITNPLEDETPGAMTGPFRSSLDYDFGFVDGVLADTPVAVAAPAGLGLLLSGLSLLCLRRRQPAEVFTGRLRTLR